MRGEKDRPPLGGDLAQQLVEGLLNERVEPGRRLVEQKQVGAVEKGLDEPDLLAVALGERPDRPLQLELEALGERLALPQPVETAERRDVTQVLARCQALVEMKVTGQVAGPAANGDALLANVQPEQLELARARPDQIEHQPDGRRLARAVRAEEAEHLARLDLEAEIDDTAAGAVELG